MWYSQEKHPNKLLKVWKENPKTCWNNEMRNETVINIYVGLTQIDEFCLNSSQDTMVFKQLSLYSPSNKKHNAPELVFSVKHTNAWFEISLMRTIIFRPHKGSLDNYLLNEVVKLPTQHRSSFVAEKIGIMQDPVVLVQMQLSDINKNTIHRTRTNIALNCSSLEMKMWTELFFMDYSRDYVCGTIMEWTSQFEFWKVIQEHLISFPCDMQSLTLAQQQEDHSIFPRMKIFWLEWETVNKVQIFDNNNQTFMSRSSYIVKQLSISHILLKVVEQVSWRSAVKLCEKEQSQLPEFGSKNDLLYMTALMRKQAFQLAIYMGHVQDDTVVSCQLSIDIGCCTPAFLAEGIFAVLVSDSFCVLKL